MSQEEFCTRASCGHGWAAHTSTGRCRACGCPEFTLPVSGSLEVEPRDDAIVLFLPGGGIAVAPKEPPLTTDEPWGDGWQTMGATDWKAGPA